MSGDIPVGGELSEAASRAESAADRDVSIANRGRPAPVATSAEKKVEPIDGQISLLDALAQPDAPDFDFEPPRVGGLYRAAPLT